jgi:hypothetical protein
MEPSPSRYVKKRVAYTILECVYPDASQKNNPKASVHNFFEYDRGEGIPEWSKGRFVRATVPEKRKAEVTT